MDPAHPFLERPPARLADWVACFDAPGLPVLAATAAEIELLRPIEDELDAHGLAGTLSADPLMTLKLLAHVAHVRRRHDADRRSDPETVTAALVMLGIPPFFRAFGPQRTVDEVIGAVPGALQGFSAVLRRSHRAARFALGFAVHRMDHDASVIHEAALLHDFAELLLWLRAPAMAQDIATRQAAEPGLRSAAAQRERLGIELAELQHALMLHWGLPPLLVRISDGRHAASPQERNVLLAIRVARHSAAGWDNPALPDDYADIGELLQLRPEAAARLLQDLDGGSGMDG